ncbi:MAG: tRNA (adenosine(37)-N6)-dimethylallyltransferase MiaA [Saprospiraceae bacterium]|nr:tRNA (adenosine(37)-N6)-dimethylallyltransferase MiaA [Saprospiraceae bacterium]
MKKEGTKYLLVIGGATATGKTALAIRLAQHFGTEILSADSRQFYREMSIGTAKPTPAELAQAPHHFIDSLSVTQDFSVGDFERAALNTLQGIYQEKDVAILVGGSGLFLQAVCDGLDDFPEVTTSIKGQVSDAFQQNGLEWLQQEIQRIDPAYFAVVDRQNPARLRRALEVYYASGMPYSTFLGKGKQQRPFTPVYILLDVPRPELYARIEARVDDMLAAGLEEEARRILPFRSATALRTVGYEEFFEYFDGNCSYEEAVDKIKQHSRNYAKRQATWFKKHGAWQAFHPGDWVEIVSFLEKTMR